MKLGDAKYIVLSIGGGWSFIHTLIAIMKDGSMYQTYQFDEHNLTADTHVDVELLMKLEMEPMLALPAKINNAVFDAPNITIFESNGNELKMVYEGYGIEPGLSNFPI